MLIVATDGGYPEDMRFRIDVRPGALGLLGIYLVVGTMVGVVVTAGTAGPVTVLTIASQFTLLCLLAVIGHEVGHAYVALTIGRRVRALVLKLGAGMVIETSADGRESRLGGVLVALGGPVASLLIAGAYLRIGATMSSPWSWAGLLALLDTLVNLLPASRSADGARAFAALNGS